MQKEELLFVRGARDECWEVSGLLSEKQEEMRRDVKQVQKYRLWVKLGAGALSLLIKRVIMHYQLFAD